MTRIFPFSARSISWGGRLRLAIVVLLLAALVLLTLPGGQAAFVEAGSAETVVMQVDGGSVQQVSFFLPPGGSCGLDSEVPIVCPLVSWNS